MKTLSPIPFLFALLFLLPACSTQLNDRASELLEGLEIETEDAAKVLATAGEIGVLLELSDFDHNGKLNGAAEWVAFLSQLVALIDAKANEPETKPGVTLEPDTPRQ